MKLVECVPNFSEGRDLDKIKLITDEIENTEDVKLLDVDPGADTNRTVVTFIGTPEGVKEAAFKAIKKASQVIDMRTHSGAHARQGATDVCPFVPVTGVSMEDCVEIAKVVAERVGKELNIPIYLYEHAATRPERQNLADVRKGEYESLEERLQLPEWKPDYGPAEFNAKAGATTIGAREFLVAYNVNINSRQRRIAHNIALNIREKGRWKRDEDRNIVRNDDGQKLRKQGTLKAVKGVGWYLEEYNLAQISMNLVDINETPPHIAFEEICRQAENWGVRVTGSELVGLIPKDCMLEAGRYFLKKQGSSTGVSEQELIRIAVHSMGLEEITPFEPMEKIIEYQVQPPEGPLVSMKVADFINELASDSPAPGGGSVAAVCGSLGAALASMVSNLTFYTKGMEEVQPEMEEVAVKAQELKAYFQAAVDRDSEAFNKVMDAMRLPKKTNEQKAAKKQAMEKANKNATMVPFGVLERSLEIYPLAEALYERGNQNALSDAGVAGLAARTAAEGAYYNVLINLPGIADEAFRKDISTKADAHLAEVLKRSDTLREKVIEKLKKEL